MAVTLPLDHAELLEKINTLATLESERGYLEFLSHVVVDAQPKKLPFRRIAEPWQWERAYRSAPALNNLAGLTQSYLGPKSFWNGYHKGSDKTHDNARELCWLLGWSKRRLRLYVCAGSEDQAALLTEAMKGLTQDNKWIGARVNVTDLTATGTSGSELHILSMNAYTSQGIFPDYLVASEVTHWMYDEGRKFWDFILSSVNKRPHCILKVETNAGHKGSWQWEERNRIEQSPYWSFFEAPVGLPLATWMNQAKIDDDSQGMEPGERDRLYKNRWIDPGEENGYLTLEDAEKCVSLELREQVIRDPFKRDLQYIVSLDYGGVHDRAAMCVMHGIPATDRVDIDRLDCWQGSHADRVDINKPPPGSDVRRSIEEWLEVTIDAFKVRTIVLDPMQLEGLAILYERKGYNVIRFEYRSGKGNYRMAQLLKASVQNQKVRWSPNAGLLPTRLNGKVVEDRTFAQELAMLVTKHMAYGYRFDHESGRHDDRAVCITGDALVTTSNGQKRIDSVTTDDTVLTREGYRRVEWSGKTGYKPTVEVTFSDGTRITGTEDHPVLSSGMWRGLGSLRVGDAVCQLSKQSNIRVERTDVTQTQRDDITESTFNATISGRQRSGTYIEMYGETTSDPYHPVMKYITRTITRSITIRQISNALVSGSMLGNTRQPIWSRDASGWRQTAVKEIESYQENGLKSSMQQLRVNRNQIDQRRGGRASRQQQYSAVSAEQNSVLTSQSKHSFARLGVSNVPSVRELHVMSIKRSGWREVYNLHVEGCHEFFANGILVHNCVGMGLCHLLPEVPPGGNPGPQQVPPVDDYGRPLTPNLDGAVRHWNLHGVNHGGMDPQRVWDRW